VTARIASTADDDEAFGGNASDNLGLGVNDTAGGLQSIPVGLRFAGSTCPRTTSPAPTSCSRPTAPAPRTARSGSRSRRAATRRNSAAARRWRRAWADESVSWDVGAWEKDGSYRSADISSLIEAVMKDQGADAMAALAFRISGTGSHSAHSFESAGAAPELVIDFGDHVA
jgi:hypothetical protein